LRALIVHPTQARATIAASRALAKAGWTVGTGSPERNFISASRASRYWHHVPAALEDVDAFLEATRAAVVKGGYELVFGGHDAEALALSAHRDELGAEVAHPPHERMVRAFDKLHLGSAARAAGLATPRTVSGDDPEVDLVVKPRIYESSKPEVQIFSDPVAAARRVAELTEAGVEHVVQERVRGQLMALVVVADRDSNVVARVQQRACRIWPPEAGTSARAETVPTDEELAERVSRLLRALGWSGLVQLQFLAPEGGAPVLIDFNGRFYGSLALGVAAGVNLPAIWAAVATGGPLPPNREAASGVRYQWLEGDLRRAYAERRGGLARDVAGSLRYAFGAAHNTSSVADPLPTLRLAASNLTASTRFRTRAARRRLRRSAR
jgi:predicted ATP-grasp superfamily ATP-dependent carboligase